MFGKFGVPELIIILVIVLVVFGGRGKISAIMGDVGSGLKAFKKSVKDEEENKSEIIEEHKEDNHNNKVSEDSSKDPTHKES